MTIPQTPKTTESTPLMKEKPLSAVAQFQVNLAELGQMPRELFMLYAMNFISSLQYYLLITLIPLYFTASLGASDLLSGVIFGGLGILIGFVSIGLGSWLSRLGVGAGLHLSYATSLLGFGIMALSGNLLLNVLAVFVFLSVSGATAWPVIELASKDYTTESVRNLSNSIIMLSNYAAGAAAGFLIDFTYSGNASTFQLYFGLAAGLAVAGHLLTFTLRPVQSQAALETECSFGHVLNSKKFWRFAALIGLLILLRAGCFGQLDATVAKYMTRTIGSDAHFGLILALHSTTMICGVFLLTMMTYYYSSYSLIVVGGTLGALSALWMTAAYDYWNIAVFVVLLSLGECIWVARLLDYTLQIAPPAQEGVYLALCNCPFYFGMMVTGVISGLLLEEFCDEAGNQDCWIVWLIVAITSLVFPLLLLLFRSALEDQEAKSSNNH